LELSWKYATARFTDSGIYIIVGIFEKVGDYMLKIALCDDDISVTTLLSQMVKDYCEKYNLSSLTRSFKNGIELLADIQNFDIIFLDIDMSGMNGIEAAQKIRKKDKNVKIVYVTNFADYQNSAFSVHVFSYILKPLTTEKIYREMDELLEYLAPVKPVSSPTEEFITDVGLRQIEIADILYFEYYSRRVRIKTKTKFYQLQSNMTQIYQLMESYGFAMPHKSFVINLLYVEHIKGYEILMTDGVLIPLSQKRSKEVRTQYNAFVEKHTKKLRNSQRRKAENV
jgi:two-component system, LytTR family, response regulator